LAQAPAARAGIAHLAARSPLKAASAQPSTMSVHRALMALLAVSTGSMADGAKASCPGEFDFQGIGSVSLVPNGWVDGGENMSFMQLEDGGIKTTMGSRAYFSSTCTAGKYDNKQYLALDLRGKTFRYTADMSKAGCGCNAALYLTNMRQNDRPSDCGDYYCDANNVCGESCAEIDIQEGNRFSWHSTLHTSSDHTGLGNGYGGGGPGWNGPRDWKAEDFGPNGRCIDTNFPLNVSAYFPVDDQGKLEAMEITLGQDGRNCLLWTRVAGYSGMAELDAAFAAGMTPIVSYWRSDDMLWMDGQGMDGNGPCWKDTPDHCGDSVRFYDFSVTPSFPPTTRTTTTTSREALRARPSSDEGQAVLRAFGLGALAMIAAQVSGVLAFLAVRTTCRRREDPTCPSVSPLRRVVAGSSQSLLALAESGGCMGPAAAQTPSESVVQTPSEHVVAQ